MHIVTFPMQAWVSLDAAGMLTAKTLEMRKGWDEVYPKYHHSSAFFYLKKVKVGKRVEMLF